MNYDIASLSSVKILLLATSLLPLRQLSLCSKSTVHTIALVYCTHDSIYLFNTSFKRYYKLKYIRLWVLRLSYSVNMIIMTQSSSLTLLSV